MNNTTMEQFLGKEYKFVSAENFEDFLIYMETPFMIRKVAVNFKPSHTLTKNDDGSYTFALSSTISNSKIIFKLGEEFEETKPTGNKTQTTITFDGNKMTQVSKANGKTVINVFEFFPEEMTETITTEGFNKVVTKKYQLVK